ncbi:hypothetical protein ACIQ7Q_01105 [Streptomyces sp. NPDC096176]|uniref:hypothetical protein n=1 Tax=Streptomyces sp. NPDC096176 TaxID=3366079 RepID=UPI0037FCB811
MTVRADSTAGHGPRRARPLPAVAIGGSSRQWPRVRQRRRRAPLRLPVSSVVLVVLLLGNADSTPVVVRAAVVAFATTELLPTGPSAELPPPRKPGKRDRSTGGSATA